ncbi:MAG: hypothetical protein WCC97_11970 [Candidatus Acidiferrales bacterium]
MLKQTTIFLHTGHMNRMAELAEGQGLKMAQLVRLVIADYLRRASRQQATGKVSRRG